jgi:hypothetical protein
MRNSGDAVKRLIERYKLGGAVYEFTDDEDNSKWYCTVKSFTQERAAKIYRASKASNRFTFLRFKSAYLPITVTFSGIILSPQCSQDLSIAHEAHFKNLAGISTPISGGQLLITKQLYKVADGKKQE